MHFVLARLHISTIHNTITSIILQISTNVLPIHAKTAVAVLTWSTASGARAPRVTREVTVKLVRNDIIM